MGVLVFSPHIDIGICIQHDGSLLLAFVVPGQVVLDVAQIASKQHGSLVFITGDLKTGTGRIEAT